VAGCAKKEIIMATHKMRKSVEGGGTTEEDTTDYTGGQEAPPMSSSAADEEAPAPRAKAAPKMVTKEELAKSGLSLRDYLNKQQGLTRRGGASAPAAAAPSRAGMQDALNAANKPFADTKRPGMMSRMREADKAIKGVREPVVAAKAPAESRMIRGTFDDRDIDPKTLLPRKRSSAASRYAAGGSVGSASKRADGIASKGKTRGRMC
jgi:hypothetical protein